MKRASLRIKDRHYDVGDNPGNFGEIITECSITKKSNSIVFDYFEDIPGFDVCRSEVTVEKDRVTILRSGKISTCMILEPEKRHISCYETPYGEIMLGVYTDALAVDLTEDGGFVEFAYTIDSNGELVSRNELKFLIETEED